MTTRTTDTRPLLRVLLLSLLLASTGCAVGTGYNLKWARTLNSGCCRGIAGCWEGEWHSCTTGHQGPLRAIITHQCGNVYQAHFHARFFKVIPFQYKIDLTAVKQADGRYRLYGSVPMPILGCYSTQGSATGCHLHARYCAKKDHGYFTLDRRVGCCH